MHLDSEFDALRPHLFGVGYRMTGSVMDAEDLVQEAYLRWRKTERSDIQSPKAFLTAIVTRLAIDHLRSARHKREVYVGQWLPEPLVGTTSSQSTGLETAESVSTAFLVLLENLTPAERAAFLLREVFDYGYDEIAAMLDRNEAACRQLVKRARDHVRLRRGRFEADLEARERLTEKFLASVASGDLEGLEAILAEDVALYSDHGGKVAAARRAITGANKVARFFLGVMKRFVPEDLESHVQMVNGQPGLVNYSGGKPYNVLSFEVVDGRIAKVYVVLNPDKLNAVPLPGMT